MRRKAEKGPRVQGPARGQVGAEAMVQVLLPMVTGLVATKQALQSWVYDAGLTALEEVFRADAERVAGKKGEHRPDRTRHHWGSTKTELPFGGRRITVSRPRVRTKAGQEVALPMVEHFRGVDPLQDRVVEQILLGVSTRGYGRSIDPPPERVRTRGTSKSAASRHLVDKTRLKVRDELGRRLNDVSLVALFLDGIEVGGRAVVVALGVTLDGTKVPLGLVLGSTENATLCTSLLQDLIERGLRIEERVLCVIDGGKGIRKALSDVLGDLAVVQRCQVHKKRNVREHLPEARKDYVGRAMSDAYASASADTARKRLRALASWLDSNGEQDAAASLREGMEDTLTVLKLGLTPTLRRTFATTNAIENMNGTIRRVTRNVKRWRNTGDMVRRWTGLGILSAEKRFRRVKGHRDLPVLVRALRSNRKTIDPSQQAA